MVATLVKLRLQVLANSMRRSPWQLVATIIGALGALWVLGLVTVGLIVLGIYGSPALASTIIVLAGSAVTLGWVLFPLLLTGAEQTLDPARLAQFPIPMRSLLVGLTLAAVLGVPGVITAVAGLATALGWMRHPIGAVASVFCAAVGVLIAIVASRAMMAASVGLQSNRRARELSGVLLFIPLVLLGPIIVGAMEGLSSTATILPSVAASLGWTPFGAAWAVPGALVAGDYGGAALRLLIALATLALLFLAWRAALARALVSPATSSSRVVARGKLGAFALVPQTPAGAVAARCLTYWRRDPRYARQLIMVPIIPLLLWFYSGFTDTPQLLVGTGPLVGFIFAMSLATDISYDGTAFATHLIDGIRGRDDRIGRVGALGLFALPITLVLAIGGVAVGGGWPQLPMIVGVSIGVLLIGFGVVSVSSARFVMPVPKAGDNPFKSAPGSTFTTGLQLFVVWAVVLVLMLPTLIIAIIGLITESQGFVWGSLASGLIVGSAVLVLGVRLGGSLLDRTGPTLLLQLRRMRGA